MADCNKPVGDRAVSYPCNLYSAHDGPCVARENAKSVRIRQEWERDHPRQLLPTVIAPAPAPRVPGALEALGMQGPPKTSVDGLTALEGRDSRREHPEAQRRRLAGEDYSPSIEERLVQTAGRVSPEEMARLGTHQDARYAAYEDRTPGRTRSEDFLPREEFYLEETAPTFEDHVVLPLPPVEPIEVTFTAGERIIQILVDIQAGLNEIATIVSSED